MDFDSVLNMELKRFWFLYNQSGRLRAESDLRQLQIMSSAQSGEAMEAALKSLELEVGQVYVWDETSPREMVIDPVTGLDEQFDREGLHSLKGMGNITG